VAVDPPSPELDPNSAVERDADDIGVEESCWQIDTSKPPDDPCETDAELCDPCVENPRCVTGQHVRGRPPVVRADHDEHPGAAGRAGADPDRHR
jgi:hypothetical protein